MRSYWSYLGTLTTVLPSETLVPNVEIGTLGKRKSPGESPGLASWLTGSVAQVHCFLQGPLVLDLLFGHISPQLLIRGLFDL